MLTEEQRAYLIDDLYKNLNFSYKSFSPRVNVYRYGESFDESLPYILVEFLPTSRNKFRSISDIIGYATEKGYYYEYGFCQIEEVTFYCYSGEFHNRNRLNGRLFTYSLAETVLRYIQRNWEYILAGMNASLDRNETYYGIRDSTYYNDITSTKIYCYSIEVFLRTQMRWNKVPIGYEGDDDKIVKTIGAYSKQSDEDEYSLIKRISIE